MTTAISKLAENTISSKELCANARRCEEMKVLVEKIMENEKVKTTYADCITKNGINVTFNYTNCKNEVHSECICSYNSDLTRAVYRDLSGLAFIDLFAPSHTSYTADCADIRHKMRRLDDNVMRMADDVAGDREMILFDYALAKETLGNIMDLRNDLIKSGDNDQLLNVATIAMLRIVRILKFAEYLLVDSLIDKFEADCIFTMPPEDDTAENVDAIQKYCGKIHECIGGYMCSEHGSKDEKDCFEEFEEIIKKIEA